MLRTLALRARPLPCSGRTPQAQRERVTLGEILDRWQPSAGLGSLVRGMRSARPGPGAPDQTSEGLRDPALGTPVNLE
jgi:hypothetical protein